MERWNFRRSNWRRRDLSVPHIVSVVMDFERAMRQHGSVWLSIDIALSPSTVFENKMYVI